MQDYRPYRSEWLFRKHLMWLQSIDPKHRYFQNKYLPDIQANLQIRLHYYYKFHSRNKHIHANYHLWNHKDKQIGIYLLIKSRLTLPLKCKKPHSCWFHTEQDWSWYL